MLSWKQGRTIVPVVKPKRTDTAPRIRVRAIIVALTVLGLCAASAPAERSQTGNLIVSLNGGISPSKLPRHLQAPVAVHLSGRVMTSDRSPTRS